MLNNYKEQNKRHNITTKKHKTTTKRFTTTAKRFKTTRKGHTINMRKQIDFTDANVFPRHLTAEKYQKETKITTQKETKQLQRDTENNHKVTKKRYKLSTKRC